MHWYRTLISYQHQTLQYLKWEFPSTESCRKCAEFTIHQESFGKFDYPVYCISSSFPLSEI